MQQLINDNKIVCDDWQLLPKEFDPTAPLPASKSIVPLDLWLARRDELTDVSALGVWLDSDQHPEAIADDIGRFDVIAINFPAFKDGRGYSYARLLRDRYGYTGELRAVGDVLRDQLFYLRRCGFNAFAVRADRDIHDALASLSDFSDAYQGAVDQPLPLFRRRVAS